LVKALEDGAAAALDVTGASRLQVGLSGGPDSLAMAAALAWATGSRRGPLAGREAWAHVVDHGLQPGSAAAAQRAVDQAAQLGLRTRLTRVTVERGPAGPEADARTARLAALLDDPDALVLLAHTLDDQAETVLLGLARGSGTRSLAGMAPRRGRLLRPWLDYRRSDTEQACRDWGLTPWRDPANQDPAYTRSRLRRALPALEDCLGPGLAEALARTARLCAQDADLLEGLAERELTARAEAESGPGPKSESRPEPGVERLRRLPPAGWTERGPTARAEAEAEPESEPGLGAERTHRLSLAGLADLHPALRSRVVLMWLRRAGLRDLTADQVDAVAALVTDWHGQAPVRLGGAAITRRSDHLGLAFCPDEGPAGRSRAPDRAWVGH
jgi:tRNA(Ile)-lysidine synthetase-like protein